MRSEQALRALGSGSGGSEEDSREIVPHERYGATLVPVVRRRSLCLASTRTGASGAVSCQAGRHRHHGPNCERGCLRRARSGRCHAKAEPSEIIGTSPEACPSPSSDWGSPAQPAASTPNSSPSHISPGAIFVPKRIPIFVYHWHTDSSSFVLGIVLLGRRTGPCNPRPSMSLRSKMYMV